MSEAQVWKCSKGHKYVAVIQAEAVWCSKCTATKGMMPAMVLERDD